MTGYLLIKRSLEFSSEPSAAITLEEFKSVLGHFPQVLWSQEVNGVTVRDSRGLHQLSPAEGISLRGQPGHIHLVYPFYGGIAVHLDDSSELRAVCEQVAGLLNAQSFGVPVE